ncbi:right-handed parallel beta-helix repeat-containing protein [Vibrio harveyi]|uniref:SO2930 family diheme c-type cytochrome n=1 Tax=Vibrio harveyi TaxID=669 RepID=UPI003BB6BA1F
MHGINKTVVAALISSSLLMGCNSDDYDEPQTSSGYELSEYGTPELCGNGQEWASAEQVTAIENLVELAEDNSVVTLPAGCFKMNNQLTVDSKNNLVLRGAGIDQTYLDFSGVDGKDGIAISGGSNITVSDLQIAEASKNGLKADGVEGIIIRDVAAVWLEVPRARDEDGNLRGTYGIYPVKSQNVLIEDTWSYGSADAGIYVGQTIGAVIRDNVAEKNIAGIEIENSSNVDVYDNLALGNTGGVLLFDLPGATTIGRLIDDVRIFDNVIRDNNLENYVDTTCQNGLGGCGVVGIVPPGTGVVILSGRNSEFFNNTITNHDSMALAMTSYLLVNGDPNAYSPLNGTSEGNAVMQGWNPVPTNMYFHDNTITNTGANPNGSLIEDMILAYTLNHQAFPALFYDGAGESLIRSQMFAPLRDALNGMTGTTNWNYLTEFTDADSNCLVNNGASVGVLVDNMDPTAIGSYAENPANADFLYENEQTTLLTAGCDSKTPLDINTVTINGVVYGYNQTEDGATDPDNPDTPNGIVGNASCTLDDVAGINWDAITRESATYGENCVSLSQYNLFEDAKDPTQNLNLAASAKGTLYEMNVELFTDYARKYRFVVMPNEASASYREQEVFDFPVGTVLIKTFALPSSTENARGENEELIETRLLIRRDSGWIALPYVWNEDKTDAYLTAVSVPFERSVEHNGETLNFTYEVPSRNECTLCHKVESDVSDPTGNTQPKGFSPIGPKARNLNSVQDVSDGSPVNQLVHWETLGLFTEALPDTPENLPKTPVFDTEAGASNLTDTELLDYAKAYLDVNCAHCHRTEGKAASNPFKFEYWRQGISEMGICARGITFHKGPSPYVIVPGDPENSVLHYRINVDNGNMMPELGRHVVHDEGVQLIADWINSIDTTGWSCVE